MDEAARFPVHARASLGFRAAKWMQARSVRGGYRLEAWLRARGCLDRCVRYRLGERVTLDVPLALRPYDRRDLQRYEACCVAALVEATAGWSEPITLVDCGADIGLMSARLVSALPRIAAVVALEPNERVFEVLRRNVERLPVEGRAEPLAVSDFVGRGALTQPAHDGSDHAAYLEPDDHGPVRVTTIDELGLPAQGSLLLKVDVEGGELAALRGAQRTLEACERFAVLFEAHRDQARRAGVDPIEAVRFLADLGAGWVRVAEEPERPVDAGRGFFEQFPGRIYNVLVASDATAGA